MKQWNDRRRDKIEEGIRNRIDIYAKFEMEKGDWENMETTELWASKTNTAL